MLQGAGPGGTVGYDVVQRRGAGGGGESAAKKQFCFPFWGEIQEFDKSPFNPLKNPQQLEADHQLGRLTSSTLK